MEIGTLPTLKLVNIHWKPVNAIITKNFMNKIQSINQFYMTNISQCVAKILLKCNVAFYL